MRRTAIIPNILFIVLSNYTELCAEKLSVNHIRFAQGFAIYCCRCIFLIISLFMGDIFSYCFMLFQIIDHALIQLGISWNWLPLEKLILFEWIFTFLHKSLMHRQKTKFILKMPSNFAECRLYYQKLSKIWENLLNTHFVTSVFMLPVKICSTAKNIWYPVKAIFTRILYHFHSQLVVKKNLQSRVRWQIKRRKKIVSDWEKRRKQSINRSVIAFKSYDE